MLGAPTVNTTPSRPDESEKVPYTHRAYLNDHAEVGVKNLLIGIIIVIVLAAFIMR